MAAVYVNNLVVNTGSTFQQTFNLESTDNNSALDLSGYTVASQMRKWAGASTATDFTASIVGWENHSTQDYDELYWNHVSKSLYAKSDGDAGGHAYNIFCSTGSQKFNVVEGKKYRAIWNLTLYSGSLPAIQLRDSCGGTSIHNFGISEQGLNQVVFHAGSTSEAVFQVYNTSTDSATFGLDNVSVGEIKGEKSPDTIINRRKELLTKINDIRNNFTPYEKYLHYDAQKITTGSAPSLGENLAAVKYEHPIGPSGSSGACRTELYDFDGFPVVYKIDTHGQNTNTTNLFMGLWNAHDKPFFNYSGSIYISF